MNDKAYKILQKLHLKKVKLVSFGQFANDKLLELKQVRSKGEFAWTCSSNFTSFVLDNNPKISHIAYLDADLYFFGNPTPIYKEWGDDSVLITPHRLPPNKQHKEAKIGIFNVGMVGFKNNLIGKKCLHWWRDKCLDWCYDIYELDRYGDQLYLNQFPKLFKKVHILKHLGGNVAPWNVTQYQVKKTGNIVMIDGQTLVFYHFHALKQLGIDLQSIGSEGYKLDEQVIKHIYQPYIKTLLRLEKLVQKIDPLVSWYSQPRRVPLSFWSQKLKTFKSWIKI
jgi:hypothetical protein